MPNSPKAPPSWVLNAVGHLRGGLSALHRATAPPSVAALELGLAAWISQAACTAVALGIPDAVRARPLTADEVAAQIGTEPAATYRLLRALTGYGVFRLRRGDRFALTRVGRKLCSNEPGSAAAMLKFVGSPQHREHWSVMEEAVRTGATAVSKVRGMPIFEYLSTDPELAAVFNDAMTGNTSAVIEYLYGAYDFSDRKLIVDVGGGHGRLLAATLERAPQARGVLADLPEVIEGAGAVLAETGVADRCTVRAGSFFESVPEGGDTYLLKNIIHDWDDDDSRRILRNVRSAIAPDGRLLLLEMVLPPGAPEHVGLIIDLEMLVSAGGRERTAVEYSKLLSDSGFRMTRVIPTRSPVSVIEAVPR